MAVVCVSVILLSLDADAQPTVDDDSSQCGSASLWEVMNMVETLASNQLQIENEVRDGIGGVRERIASECEKTNETMLVNEIRDVKRLLESENETRLEEVVTEMKGEIRDVKRLLESGNETRLEDVVTEMKGEIRDVKRLLESGNETRLEDVVTDMKGEIRDVKRLLESGNETRLEDVVTEMKDEITDEIRDVKRTIASGCEENNVTRATEEQAREEIRDMVRILVSESREANGTRLEEMVNMISVIASNQQEMKDGMLEMKDEMRENVVEMRKMRDEMKNETDRVRAEMEEVKRLVLSRPTECECATVKPTEYNTNPAVTTSTSPPLHGTVQPSKQQLVSALVCEY